MKTNTVLAARWRTGSKNNPPRRIRRPHELRANQLRLWFSTLAYLLLAVLREHGLQGTELATARCDTVRLKLLKIGAVATVTFRKVWLRLSSACPFQTLFEQVLSNLRAWRSAESLTWELISTG